MVRLGERFTGVASFFLACAPFFFLTCFAIFFFDCAAFAVEPDGITGLPTDVTSLLSIAGIWQPVDQQYVTSSNPGTLGNNFYGTFTSDSTQREHIILTGWNYSGFGTGATSTIPVRFAIFQQQPDGTMALATEHFASDSLTSGGGSVVVADFNGDGLPDIFLAAHNESPLIAMPSTALLSNGTGSFKKVTLNDHVMAHDANLGMVNNVPTVFTYTFNPGDHNPYYQFVNGAFVETIAAGITNTNGVSSAVAQFIAPGKYGMMISDLQYGPGFQFTPHNHQIALYSFDGRDIGSAPQQILSGYFNSRSQYANVSSNLGPGDTHTPRLRVDDFNHDGQPDVIAQATLFDIGLSHFPVALQMLQNSGNGQFSEVSDSFASNIGVLQQILDYTMQIRDFDGSGINSYFSGSLVPQDCSSNSCTPRNDLQTNFLLVNDGSGLLHVALHQQFDTWRASILQFVQSKLDSSYFIDQSTPRFLAYRTPNNKINLLAMVTAQAKVAGIFTSRYVIVNIPVQLDLASAYTAPMTVANRNGSHLIRTFAGNDVIYSGHNGGYSHVDGGLGTNKVIYSGPSANYAISQLADGSWKVTDNVGAEGTDTLVRIQSLQFTDKTITLPTTYVGTVREGAVFSSAQAGSLSFLRFYNAGATAGSVNVTLSDQTSGQTVAQWTSPSIAPGTAPQFDIRNLESVAGAGFTKPQFYSVSAQSPFPGSFQHVLWHPSDGTLTNLSTCDSGVTAVPTRLVNVHSSLTGSQGYPSSVVVYNTGTVAASATLVISDARNGNQLGTYNTGSIPANGQAIVGVSAMEVAAKITPTGDLNHYVIATQGQFSGYLQHLVNNQKAGVVSDMTTVCEIGTTQAVVSSSTVREGAIFSSAQAGSLSFLRFYNAGATAGTVNVTLSDQTSGQTIAQWTSPSIAPGTAPQFDIRNLESAATSGFTKPQFYSVSAQSQFPGSFQHVLWHPSDGTLTNLSTCDSGITAVPTRLVNVHSSLTGSQGYPSSVVVYNTGTVPASATLVMSDARNGNQLGTYNTGSIPANGQAIIAVSDMETAAKVTPTGDLNHYVIATQGQFSGYLQHLVNNQKAGVVSDMTTVCALPSPP